MRLNANVAANGGKDQNDTWELNKKMKLEWLYKFFSKSELNTLPESSDV